MVDITKFPYFSYSCITDPLFQSLKNQANIQFFSFHRKYLNAEQFLISSAKEHNIEYYSRGFYRYGLFERDPQTFESAFHMWDHLPCDPHKIYEHVRREHSLAHGLTIVQQHGVYCDIFIFATNPNNTLVNNFYLNQKELFLKLIGDFYDTLAPTLHELSHHKVFVPFNTSNNEHSLIMLSPRQQDCAVLMRDGLTAKEIAKALRLSPRTVEEYIDTMKAKFKAKNRSHLVGMLQKHRNKKAAIRFLSRLLGSYPAPRVMVTDKLKSYRKPIQFMCRQTEHRSHKGLNNRVENAHQPTRRKEKCSIKFKSPQGAQRTLSLMGKVRNIFAIDVGRYTKSPRTKSSFCSCFCHMV